MSKVAITEQYLTDIADAIREKTGLTTTYKPSEMADAISSISGGGGIIPKGSITITENDTYNVTSYASAIVNVPTGSTINNQDKTATPTESSQIITYDSGYTGLDQVTISAIPNTYVGSSISRNSSSDLTVSGAAVNVPAGYYSEDAAASVASGTAGTPKATKGTVSNHAVLITPSVTNTTGYITGGTKNGTAVSVSASELVSGTLSVSSNGTKDVTNYASVNVNVGGDSPTIEALTVTPSESEQTFNSSSVDGYKPVTVSAISSTYVGSEIAQRDSDDLTTSGATVSVPAGYYSAAASKSVASGTEGTPTASKGTVTNNSITVTSSVTNTAGYISGGTHSGTAVSVSASELVSGTYSVTASGTHDVTNYASASVPAGTTTAPTSISGTTASVSTGTDTLTLTKTVSVTPRVTTAGYVSSGTAGNSSISLTANVTVDPTPTASGATVTIPEGYYTEQTTKSVSSGSAKGPTSLSGSSATVTTGTNTLTLTKTGVTTTPTVSAGYVSSATASTATVTLTASVPTKAAATITPTTTNQTIAAGTYLTGTQTIAGDADLVGSNILSTANIFGVQGKVVVQNVYHGSSAPSSSTGSNGDIYIQS